MCSWSESQSPHLSLNSVLEHICPPSLPPFISPSLPTSARGTQSNHREPLSHHRCIASSIPLPFCPAPSPHTLFCALCVCVCEGITHPEAPFCTDIGMLWTLVLNSQASCGAAASRFSLQHLHTNVGAGGIMHVEMMCFSPACAPSVSGSAYMHFSI